MDEVSTTSDECGARAPGNGRETLSDLYNQVLQLLSSRLSENSILALQEELQLMQRCSYYLEIQREDWVPHADQPTIRLSDSTVWSLIDQQRLQRAMTLAKSQVNLLLAVLALLYEEIVRGCRELEAFVIKYNQGLVDSDMAASIQLKLQQTHQHVNDFMTRKTRNLGPLELQNQLIPNTSNFPIPQLTVSLAIKMPVVFDRFESCASSTSVHLCWEIEGETSKEPNEPFEIQVKSLHPTSDDQNQFSKSACQSYSIQVNNLISGRYYEFSVRRVDTVSLVYGVWTDTITLKTLDIPK